MAYLSVDTSLPMLLAYCGTITKLLCETGRADLIARYVRPMAKGKLLQVRHLGQSLQAFVRKRHFSEG